jgi:hypothetical protein
MGHRCRNSCPVVPPKLKFHPVRHEVSSGAPSPNPTHGVGASRGTGSTRNASRAHLSAKVSTLRRLYSPSPRLLRRIMALYRRQPCSGIANSCMGARVTVNACRASRPSSPGPPPFPAHIRLYKLDARCCLFANPHRREKKCHVASS